MPPSSPFPQILQPGEVEFFKSLMVLTNAKMNKRPTELTSTMLVGLSAINERVTHDLQALDHMEKIAGEETPKRTAELSKKLDTELRSTLDKMRAKNSRFFDQLGRLERRVTDLARRNDKLVRKQSEMDRFQADRAHQTRLIAEISQKMERVKNLKENKDFDSKRGTSRGQLRRPTWDDPAGTERKADLLVILGRLKEGVVALSESLTSTERLAEEVRRLSPADHIYK